jgi:hypothetical protein
MELDMTFFSRTARAAFAASLAPGAQASPLVNGGFEQPLTPGGVIPGWTQGLGTEGVISTPTSQTSFGGTTFNPTEGTQFADIVAGAAGVYTTLSQSFTIGGAGGQISGDAAFLGNDFAPNNDDGYVRILSGQNVIATLFSSNVAAVGDLGSTDWTAFSLQLAAGVYTIEAGVRNDGDNQLPSELLLDNVQATDAPLPGALPLFATGLGMLGVAGLRRKRKAAAK